MTALRSKISRLAAVDEDFSRRLRERRHRHRRRSATYRVLFAAAGFAVLFAGVLMLVLPGPGLLVTGIALTMLALEFAWAEHLVSRLAEKLQAARRQAMRRRRRKRIPEAADDYAG